MGNDLAPGDIMIVDDNPANLRLLEDMLSDRGHEVRSFPLGRLAISAALQLAPDLILLDVNMPEMNGYEVCERLKATDALAEIPVVFLSALTDTQDKIRAFRSGAVDYISKPFQFEEVHARVETHLRLHSLQRLLKCQNEHLEQAVAARTAELADANQRLTVLDRAKGEFLNLISHELRTPLNGIVGIGELILEGMPSTPDNEDLRTVFELSRRRILSIVDDALLLCEIDVSGHRFHSAPISLQETLSQAVARIAEFAASHNVDLVVSEPSCPSLVVANEDLLARALQALLEAAVRFCDAGKSVRITQDCIEGSTRLIIESAGKTIPNAALSKFFDLFAIDEASTPGKDLGLGPAIASRVLSLLGGSVTVANQNPPGITLIVSLSKTGSSNQ